MTRALGVLLALGLSTGCATDGAYPGARLGVVTIGPDIGWSRTYGNGLLVSPPYAYGREPFFAYGREPFFRHPYGYGYGRGRFQRRDDDDRPFRPKRHVLCDPDEKLCYKHGHPDRSETRAYFGKKAARQID